MPVTEELLACTHDCDPFEQTGCMDPAACHIFEPRDPELAYADCAIIEGAGRLEPCEYQEDCEAGLICVGTDRGPACLGLCLSGADCVPGERCLYFSDGRALERQEYGPCLP